MKCKRCGRIIHSTVSPYKPCRICRDELIAYEYPERRVHPRRSAGR